MKLCDQILQLWQTKQRKLAMQALYEQEPSLIEEHRKEHRERKFAAFMLVVLYVGEILISWEASGEMANVISSAAGLPQSQWLYLASALLLPAIIIALLLVVKKVSDPTKTDEKSKQLNENHQSGAVSDEKYAEQYRIYSRKKQILLLQKWLYLGIVSVFYFKVWSSISDAESQMLASETAIPTIDEIFFGEGSALTSTQISEKVGLPFSTLIGGIMLIVLAGHVYVVFSKLKMTGKLLPFAKFNPKKNLDEIEEAEVQTVQRSREVIRQIDNPENASFVDELMKFVSPPIRKVINLTWGNEVFPTEPKDDFPQLPPLMMGYKKILGSYGLPHDKEGPHGDEGTTPPPSSDRWITGSDDRN